MAKENCQNGMEKEKRKKRNRKKKSRKERKKHIYRGLGPTYIQRRMMSKDESKRKEKKKKKYVKKKGVFLATRRGLSHGRTRDTFFCLAFK